MTSWESDRIGELHTTREQILALPTADPTATRYGILSLHLARYEKKERQRIAHLIYTNEWRCAQRPLYGIDLRQCLAFSTPSVLLPYSRSTSYAKAWIDTTPAIRNLVLSYEQRAETLYEQLTRFTCITSPALAPSPMLHCSHPDPSKITATTRATYLLTQVRALAHITIDFGNIMISFLFSI